MAVGSDEAPIPPVLRLCSEMEYQLLTLRKLIAFQYTLHSSASHHAFARRSGSALRCPLLPRLARPAEASTWAEPSSEQKLLSLFSAGVIYCFVWCLSLQGGDSKALMCVSA